MANDRFTTSRTLDRARQGARERYHWIDEGRHGAVQAVQRIQAVAYRYNFLGDRRSAVSQCSVRTAFAASSVAALASHWAGIQKSLTRTKQEPIMTLIRWSCRPMPRNDWRIVDSEVVPRRRRPVDALRTRSCRRPADDRGDDSRQEAEARTGCCGWNGNREMAPQRLEKIDSAPGNGAPAARVGMERRNCAVRGGFNPLVCCRRG